VFIATFALLSCNEKQSLRTEFFLPKSVSVNIDSFQTQKVLKHPVRMVANDSLIVVCNKNTDTLYRVFSQPNCNYLGWFGREGKGPRELLANNPTGLRFYRDQLQVADLKKIYYLKFPKGFIQDNFIIKESYSIPGNLIAFNQIFRLDKECICGINDLRNTSQSMDSFNIKTYEVGSFVDYPDFGFSVPEDTKNAVYDFNLDIRPDRSKFAVVYSFFPLLRIVDNKGTILKECYIKRLPKQIEFKNLGTRDSNLLYGIVYYSYIRATDQYIYLLYNPRKGEKVTKRRFKHTPIGQKEVHIFKWNGQPVARIKLKQGTLSFAPSSDDHYLYCTNMYSMDKIYRYDLRQILNQETLKP
jgi:hypothetical protein